MKRIRCSEARRRGVAGSPKYASSSAASAVVVEAVVHGEVAEVEVAVAHARVLPVDDPDPRPVGGSGCPPAGRCGRAPARARGRAAPSRSPSRACAPRRRPSGELAAALLRGLRRSPRRPGTRENVGGQLLAAVVHRRSAPATLEQCSGPRRSSSDHRASLDERGHEARAGSRASPRTGGPDARPRGRAGRRPLGAAVDAQQSVSLPGSRIT